MIRLSVPACRTLLAVFAVFMLVAQCGEKSTEDTGKSEDTTSYLFARYPVSIYSVAGSKARTDYVATLVKAERVELLNRTEVGEKKVPYVKVRAAGDKIGFAEERHFAPDVAVVTAESPNLLQRPLITAARGYNADLVKQGTIAFIIGRAEEAETWYEVSGSTAGGFFRGWIREAETGRDERLLTEAVLFDKAMTQLKSDKEAGQKKGLEALKQLQTESHTMIADLAAKALEEASQDTEETPEAPAPPEEAPKEAHTEQAE